MEGDDNKELVNEMKMLLVRNQMQLIFSDLQSCLWVDLHLHCQGSARRCRRMNVLWQWLVEQGLSFDSWAGRYYSSESTAREPGLSRRKIGQCMGW